MLLAILFLFISSSQALPQGAPSSVCDSMMPNHKGVPPQRGGAPYGIFPRRTSNGVQVTITSTLGVKFQGFMVQGRTPRGEALGSFELTDGLAHTLECSNPRDSLTHNSPEAKDSLEVLWKPPVGYEGDVIFNGTIAQDFSTFWVGVQSLPVEISRRSVTDPAFNLPQGIPPTPPPPALPRPTSQEAATEFDPFYNGCSVNKLCFGAPAKCVESKNCKAVVAVTVRVDRYDFELKATGNAAWVGVGLSEDDKMGDDSVVECVRGSNNIVNAYMSWTSGSPNYGAARLTNARLGIQLINSSVIDDTLYCKVRRNARTVVRGKTFDLQKEQYYLLIASGSNVESRSVAFHDIVYLASAKRQNMADVSRLEGASKLLIRLHGSFMLAAWIGTAAVGILLARYYRRTWVDSSLCGKDLWFAWHRMFMVLTWTLTMVAFILIFVELRAWSAERNPHAILGTITTIICFFQPIGAYFRPHPGTSKRPIFNWGHWLAGNLAHILAVVTIFFAVKLSKAELPEFMDWILVAFVAFHVIMHIILSILNCISEKNSDGRVTSLPMKDFNGSGRTALYSDRTEDAPRSGVRKFLLGLYIFIDLIIVIALIVITALAPIEQTWENLRSSMMDSK